MTSLYAIADGKLRPAVRRALSRESLIEDWVAADLALLGLDALSSGGKCLLTMGSLSTSWRWTSQAVHHRVEEEPRAARDCGPGS